MLVSGSSPKTVASIGPKRAYSTAASSTASVGAVRQRSSRKRSSAIAIADPSYIQRLPTHCRNCPREHGLYGRKFFTFQARTEFCKGLAPKPRERSRQKKGRPAGRPSQ